jgi:uroporphyrinogen III methyltransferase / synthase
VRIVVTRPAEQARPLVEKLEALGHEVVVCPLIAIEPLGDEPIDLRDYDWVLVTSTNGARELGRRRSGEPKRLGAIGPATADALRAEGLEPDLIAEVSTQEALAAALPRPVGRVLLAAAEGARTHLLDAVGAELVPLYRTRELEPELPDADLVVLASASAARALAKSGSVLPAVSIGPETTRAARERGIDVVREAEPHTVEGLAAAVAAIS